MDNVKKYSTLDEHEKTKELLEKLYNVTKPIENDYPKHYEWYHEKFIRELDGVRREIYYYEQDNQILGVVFLKNTSEEKKICTIMVDSNSRRQGIGSILLEKAFEFLETNTPLISMPDYKEQCFEKIINKYNWIKMQSIDSFYSQNKEIVFNGRLII